MKILGGIKINIVVQLIFYHFFSQSQGDLDG